MAGSAPLVVAQVVDDLSVGGMERAAINLANGLVDLGYESHIISTRGRGALQPCVTDQVRSWFAHRRKRWDIPGLRRIAAYMDEHGFDVVHSHNQHSSYLVRFVLHFCRSRPLHVMTDQNGPGLHNRRQALLDRMLLRGLDGFVGVTEALRDRAQRLLSLPVERCIYVINGIQIPPPHEPWEGRPTVIQVANLQWPKNHAMAMRAAAILRRRVPDLHWVCVGRVADPPNEYVSEVRSLIDSLKLADCVTLTGVQTDVPSLLARAHAGVLTSDSEALPLSVLEYMAAELAVVMTDVGQGPAIIRAAQAGRTVPRGDPEAMAEALADVLTDLDAARRMGVRGRAHVIEDFSVAAMARQVDGLYRQLLRTRRSGLTQATPAR